MIHVILKSLTIASLILFLATAGLCIRSCWIADGYRIVTTGPQNLTPWKAPSSIWRDKGVYDATVLYLNNGKLKFLHYRQIRCTPAEANRPPTGYVGKIDDDRVLSSTAIFEHGGIVRPAKSFVLAASRYIYDVSISDFDARYFPIPFAILPAIWLLIRLIARARKRSGYCRCGYDLRATPDRCPECGVLVK